MSTASDATKTGKLRLGGSNLAGAVATGLSFQIFFHGGTYIDTLYTELSTATLMIWGTYGLLRAVQQQSLGWFFGSGMLMGLLALGKAAFAYIGVVAVPLLMAALLLAYGLAGNVSETAGAIAGLILALVWPALLRASLQFRLAQTSWRGLRFSFRGSMKDAYMVFLVIGRRDTVYRSRRTQLFIFTNNTCSRILRNHKPGM